MLSKTLTLSAAFALSTATAAYGHSKTEEYAEPSASGLEAIGAFPTEEDVCQKIEITERVEDFAKKGWFLIACPHHEEGAIEDRKAQGAKRIKMVGDWLVLRVREK